MSGNKRLNERDVKEMGRILHCLVFPSFKIFLTLLAVNLVIFAIATPLSTTSYGLRLFLDVSTFESALMLVIGPVLLFRSTSFVENRGSKILLAGALLFVLSSAVGLATV